MDPSLWVTRYYDDEAHHQRYGDRPPPVTCGACGSVYLSGPYAGAMFEPGKRQEAEEICGRCCDLSSEELRETMRMHAARLQNFAGWLLAMSEWAEITTGPDMCTVEED